MTIAATTIKSGVARDRPQPRFSSVCHGRHASCSPPRPAVPGRVHRRYRACVSHGLARAPADGRVSQDRRRRPAESSRARAPGGASHGWRQAWLATEDSIGDRLTFVPPFVNERFDGPPFWSCTFTALLNGANVGWLGQKPATHAEVAAACRGVGRFGHARRQPSEPHGPGDEGPLQDQSVAIERCSEKEAQRRLAQRLGARRRRDLRRAAGPAPALEPAVQARPPGARSSAGRPAGRASSTRWPRWARRMPASGSPGPTSRGRGGRPSSSGSRKAST